MNEGPVATLLGLRGAPAAGESDHGRARRAAGRAHRRQASTSRISSAAASVDAVRRGKARGVRVTAEATPHHLLLTDELVRETEYDTSTKMNPPLRAEADRQALIEGLRDGDDRLHRHRPRAAHGGRQEGRVRPGRVRHRRAGDGGARSAWTVWSRAGPDQPAAGSSEPVSRRGPRASSACPAGTLAPARPRT